MKVMHLHKIVYTIAVCLLVAGASIAVPPFPIEGARGKLELCSTLADRLPCAQAAGPWEHICKASVAVSCSTVTHAVEMSRHMPEHVYNFVHTVTESDRPEVAVHGIVRFVGVSLGLGLMLLGKFLYTPCLFYLPAILVGYTAAEPLVPHLQSQFGLSEGATYLLGAFAGLLLAFMQRHVFVWLLGMLLGVMSFIGLLVGTSLLANLPYQVVLAIAAMCALSGSSLVWHMERTKAWKVIACALVGAILFTDAIGVCQISTFFQICVCSVLVFYSTWRQLGTDSSSRKAAAAAKLAEEARAEEEKRRKKKGVLGSLLSICWRAAYGACRWGWRMAFSSVKSKTE